MTIRKYREGDLVRILPFDEIDLKDVGDDYSRTSCFGISRNTIDEYARNLDGVALAVCGVYNLSDRNRTVYYHLRMKNCANTSIGFEWAQGMIAPFVEDEEDEPLCDADPNDLIRFLMA